MTSPRLMIVLALWVISCGGCGEREVAAPATEKKEQPVSQEPRVNYPSHWTQEDIEQFKREEAETKVKKQQQFEAEMLDEETQKAFIKIRDEAFARREEGYFSKYEIAVQKVRYESFAIQDDLEKSRFEHQEVVGKTLDQFLEKWYDPSDVVEMTPEQLDAYLRSQGIIAGPGIIPRPDDPKPGDPRYPTPKAQ